MEVLDVKRNSRAWDAGLRKGDVIVSVNRQSVASLLDLSAITRAVGDNSLLLNVQRGNSALFVVIR